MAPTLFRNKSQCNWRAAALAARIEYDGFLRGKYLLLANLLTPVLYFLFIITALAPSIGYVSFHGKLVGYGEYALAGLMAMNMMTQMGRVMYRVASDRKNGTFAMKMQCGIRPWLYMAVMGVTAVCGYILQMICFFLLCYWQDFAMLTLPFFYAVLTGIVSMAFWISLGTVLSAFSGEGMVRNLVLDMVMILITFSAPSFYSYEAAPTFLQYAAMINPLSYQLEIMRRAVFGMDFGIHLIFLCIGCLAVWSVASLAVKRIPLMEKKKVF